jgi:hypothetical protein
MTASGGQLPIILQTVRVKADFLNPFDEPNPTGKSLLLIRIRVNPSK